MLGMHLISNQKSIEVVSHFREFLYTAFNCLGVYWVLFPFIKDHGYPSLEKYKQLLPLHQSTASLTNSIFLYLCGCLVICIVIVFTQKIIAAYLRLNKVMFALEANISLLFVVILWGMPGGKLTLPLFLLRCFLSALLFKGAVDGKEYGHKIPKIFNALFDVSSLIVLSLFFYTYLFPYVFAGFKMTTFFKFIAVLPILLCLVHYQHQFRKFILLGIDIIILALMVILVFKNDASYFDYSAFLGAVNDVILGKDILANVIISYGFFNVYFVAILFELFKVQDYYIGLSLIISVLYVLGYSSVYIFLRIYTQNFLLSIAALFIILYIDFFSLYIPVHWLPQATLLRFGSYLPVFLCLFALERRNFKGGEWLFASLVAVLFFWATEYGIYMLTSLIGVMVCRYLVDRQSDQKQWVYRFLKIGTVFTIVIVILTVRILIKYGHGPIWSDLYYFQRLYTRSGLAMNQLKTIDLWIIPFVMYWTTIYVCLKYYKYLRYHDTWLFLSFFALQFFLYFVGRGGIYALARVGLPCIILSAVGLGFLLKKNLEIGISRQRIPLKYILCAFVFFICVIVVDSIIKEGRDVSLTHLILDNPKRFIKNSKTSSVTKFLKSTENYRKFQNDVTNIRRLIPENEPLAILSKNDTLYYIYAQRKSLFKNSFYAHFLTFPQLSGMATTILNSRVKYLFMDNSFFQCYDNTVTWHNPYVYELIRTRFIKQDSLGFLDMYERVQ